MWKILHLIWNFDFTANKPAGVTIHLNGVVYLRKGTKMLSAKPCDILIKGSCVFYDISLSLYFLSSHYLDMTVSTTHDLIQIQKTFSPALLCTSVMIFWMLNPNRRHICFTACILQPRQWECAGREPLSGCCSVGWKRTQ